MDEGVRRAEIVAVLSLASDPAMGQPAGFGLRVCLASLALGKAIGLGLEERAEIYHYALLRHAGCTAETDQLAALFGDEIALRQGIARIDEGRPGELLPVVMRRLGAANAGRSPVLRAVAMVAGLLRADAVVSEVFTAHCEAAGRLAARLGLPASVSAQLGQSHERWDGKGPAGARGEAIAPAVRLVSVVQDALTLVEVVGEAEALGVIEARAGRAYDPRLVAALIDHPPVLRDRREEQALWDAVIAAAPDDAVLEGAALDEAIEVLDDFIDLKAPVIAGHSRAVGTLTRGAAEAAKLPVEDAARLYRAGLLHDLGYAAVPAQWRLGQGGEQARLHPYYGERLLGWSAALRPIGRVVAEHHERLDGTGFHAQSRATEQSREGRLLATVEAYQALIEDRPFRVTLSPADAAARLREEARAGRLDSAAVAAVLEAAGQRGRSRKPALPAGLTVREAEILRQISAGRQVKEIAQALGIAPKTVGNHVQNLYAKIGVSTRAGATLFALENGLVGPSGEI